MTTKRKAVALVDLFPALLLRAQLRGAAVAELGGKARITVRVDPVVNGWRVVTVAFSRLGVRVGDQERVIFRCDCKIPETAERLPPSAPDQTRVTDNTVDPPRDRYFVGYRWSVPATR